MLQTVLFVAGLALMAVGVGMYSLPAGVITAGVFCATCGLIVERYRTMGGRK